MNKRVLAVVAHADDEAIGCGGTLLRHKEEGDSVLVIIVAELGGLRNKLEIPKALKENISQFCIDYVCLNFPDQRLDTIPSLDITQNIERHIKEYIPDVVYTHSPNDANLDHVEVYTAVRVAARAVPKLLCFEIPSPGIVTGFKPNYFNQIAWSPKEQFLFNYACEMRDAPHPRSVEILRAKAQIAGSVSSYLFAEPFEVERWGNEFTYCR